MNQVAWLSVFFMVISCLVGFGIPVALLIYFRARKRADILPFFVGCVVMLLFAFLLEQSAHRIILKTNVGQMIQSNQWLYALYGGLMAGLFEETGRYIAFNTVLRKKIEKDVNALMYGAGHGGFEAIALLGISNVNNIIYSVMINAGEVDTLTGSLTGTAKQQIEIAVFTLISTPSYHFLLGAVERIFAVAIHISISVLVWFAVKNRNKRWLYPVAIVLHCFIDAMTVLVAGYNIPILAVEALVGIVSILYVLIGRRIWINEHKSDEELNGYNDRM